MFLIRDGFEYITASDMFLIRGGSKYVTATNIQKIKNSETIQKILKK